MPDLFDDFNRADSYPSGLGTTSVGAAAWVVGRGTWGVVSNRARNASLENSLTYVNSSEFDGRVSVKFYSLTDAGILFRASNASNYCVVAIKPTTIQLNRVAANIFTPVGPIYSYSFAAGDLVTVRMSGSAVSVLLNGAEVIASQTITFNQNETRHGLWTYKDTGVEFEDFRFTTSLTDNPTSATVSGPSTGLISTESTAFTVTLNAPSVGTTTVNLASTDGGDVFHATSGGSTVSSIDIADGQTVGTFYLLPDSTVDARTITPTASGITFTPTSLTYTTTPPALVAGTASFVSSGPAAILVESTAASGGAGSITSKWQRNEDGGAWSDLSDGDGVSGATTAELTDGSVSPGTLYGYRCVFTDGASQTSTSNTVTAQVYSGGSISGGTSNPFQSSLIRGA